MKMETPMLRKIVDDEKIYSYALKENTFGMRKKLRSVISASVAKEFPIIYRKGRTVNMPRIPSMT
ncbi:hypothetical protein D3C76_1285840 [compost metagenome]